MTKRIAVIGAGAIGGYFGGHLSLKGHDVTFVDAWPEHVETVRHEGLRIETPDGDAVTVAVRMLNVGDVQSLVREEPIDMAFIAVKSYDTMWATQLILPYLAANAPVVSLQNSLNEEAIAALAGRELTFGCAIGSLACELVEAGRIKRMTRRGHVVVGALAGAVTPEVEEIAAVLADVEESSTTSNLVGVKWSKLVINAMRNGLSAMTGMSGRERDSNPVTRWLGIRLGGQTVRIGETMGLKLEDTIFDFAMLAAAAEGDEEAIEKIAKRMMEVAETRSNEQRPSMGQDIRKGRRTETDAINGLVASRGFELGIDASLHQKVHETILRIERGEAAPSPMLAEGL